jgi:fumarate hydratase subunit beta
MLEIQLPMSEIIVENLRAGDSLLLSGVIYVARDAAHKRMIDVLMRGQSLPFDVKDQIIYYMGPSPARPGKVIGAAGPTTSGRMDVYSELLMEQGLKGMIGKGSRSAAVKQSMRKHKAVYFGAIGGAGALLSKTISKCEIIGFKELGAEALRKIEVIQFPVTVINDIYGGDLYLEGKGRFRTS